MNHSDAFRDAIAAAGLTPPSEIIGDGKLHRFSSNGNAKDKAGWYVFHDDERPAGRFGCNRGGIDATWSSNSSKEFTPEEKAAWKRKMQDAAAQRDADRKAEVAQAAVDAADMWASSQAPDGHPYLARKHIDGHGARRAGDMLLIPMRHGPKDLVGLQRIYPDGSKRFIKGTPLAGAYCTLGKPTKNGPIAIVEGWATGVSVFMATGYCTVVAFNAGNLVAVAQKIRKALPDAVIIMGADDDAWTDGNPGITAATEAARAIGAMLAIPRWYGDRPEKHTDFNDLHAGEGLAAVAECFQAADDPEPTGTGPGPARKIVSAADQVQHAEPSSGVENSGSSESGAYPSPPIAAVLQTPSASVILPGAGSDVQILPTQGRQKLTPYELGHPQNYVGADDEMFIYTGTPMRTAELFHATLPEGGRILHWRGDFYGWDGTRYVIRDRIYIEQRLYYFMVECKTVKNTKEGEEIVGFSPNTSKVNDVAHSLRAVCYADVPEPQCWIEQFPGDPPAGEIIAFRNGFLHWPTRTMYPATDRLFVTSALEFDYDPHAAPATSWTTFLDGLWPDDPESIMALADMFGYLLTDDTSQQKMFMLIGPPRSGKGTILRVLESLVGYHNRVSPSLAGIGTQFGLQPLIGKRLAMISDARLSGKTDQQPIVENLLRISGEDALSIDRKNISAWTGKLPTRFVLASNELPAFSDASAALANRFMLFKFTQSFLGKEDMGLTGKLLKELPSIVLWALDGLERLQKRGYLLRPKSSQELADDMVEQTSPMSAFVAEKCIVGAGNGCDRDDLFAVWKTWCSDQGRDHPGTKVSFGRQLSAAFPGIRRSQPREAGTRLNLYSGIRLRNEYDGDD